MTTLYHFTSKGQLKKILAMGEILMTPNPFIPPGGQKVPVLWLTDKDGVEQGPDTLAHGLNLAGTVQGFVVDRIEVRFTVEVPDDEVVSWDDYCDAYQIDRRTRRQLAKWPLNSAWWVPFQRSIPASEWVEIGVGRGVWTPMFVPDPDGYVPDVPTEEEPSDD